MTDLPRIAVTRPQAADVGYAGDAYPRTITLRLPERPTMPCGVTPDQACEHEGAIAIPEGTRVEVGWRDVNPNGSGDWQWVPVATATVASVSKHTTFNMYGDTLAWEWIVTLTDVEVVT